MIVGIHQPNFIPYIGYFYKIAACDKFVFLDDVQYIKNSFADRNSIKTPQGPCYLKLPVKGKNHDDNYNLIKISKNIDWKHKHLKTMEFNYKRAPFFDIVYSEIETLLSSNLETLSDFNANIIIAISKELGFETDFFFSHTINTDDSTSTDRIIKIVKALDGDAYLSGQGGHAYQDEAEFVDNSIDLIYTDFRHPIYRQLWGEFCENLSIVDLLFNEGFENSAQVIRGSGKINL